MKGQKIPRYRDLHHARETALFFLMWPDIGSSLLLVSSSRTICEQDRKLRQLLCLKNCKNKSKSKNYTQKCPLPPPEATTTNTYGQCGRPSNCLSVGANPSPLARIRTPSATVFFNSWEPQNLPTTIIIETSELRGREVYMMWEVNHIGIDSL